MEDFLNQLPGVKESAVIGVPHSDFGEAVVALIVCEKNTAPDEQTIINTLKQDLASFKVPKRVIWLETLPRNVMGKIQKNILRHTHSDALRN